MLRLFLRSISDSKEKFKFAKWRGGRDKDGAKHFWCPICIENPGNKEDALICKFIYNVNQTDFFFVGEAYRLDRPKLIPNQGRFPS